MSKGLASNCKAEKMKNPEKNTKKKTWPVKAYNDAEFLHSPAGRQVRVLCEFEEPKSRFRKYRINNTIVFFGSARILSKSECQKNLRNLKRKTTSLPKMTPTMQKKFELAERDLVMSRYYEEAVQLSAKITKWSQKIKDPLRKFYICSGGGPGIMEAANRGAHSVGGKSIGLNISLPMEQDPNPYQTRDLSFEFHYFFIRKFWFFYLSKAMIVFPGGYGTMDEFFELLTLVQTQKTKKHMSIILYGKSFWNELLDFDAMQRWGVISPEDLKLFKVVDDVDTAFRYLKDELTEHYLNK